MSTTTGIGIALGQSVQTDSKDWYRCVQPLNCGKNATVYLMLRTSARNVGTFYALKILNEPSGSTSAARFATEVSIINSVNDPAIIKIVDTGVFTAQANAYPFYICDYYPSSLEDVIRRGASLTARLAFCVQLLSALKALASAGLPIVHRDVKPANIFVSGLHCVVGDFGLASSLGTSQGNNSPASLHHYRSPDIVDEINGVALITPKSDVFQLGLTFSELFTGINPCIESTGGSDAVVIDEVPHIHGFLGARLRKTIEKMLTMKAGDRPSADELVNVFQGFLFEAVTHLYHLENRVV